MKPATKGRVFGAVVMMTSVFALSAVAQEVLTRDTIRGAIEDAIAAQTIRSAEIKFGIGQVKVETITADGQKVETVYGEDANGNLIVLKSETESAAGDDLGRTGLEVKSLSRDFVDDGDDDGSDDDDDDSDDDNGGDDDGDDSDDDSGHDDDGDDDHSGSGSDGSDDHGSDDD